VSTPDIALIGKAGAGKTSLAELLCNRFDLGYQRASFAAPLKIMCGTETVRELLQDVGHGVRELTGGLGWVRLLLHEMDRRKEDEERLAEVPQVLRFVVDDCRYLNELETLRKEGFVVIRVEASRNTRVARLRANGKLTDEARLDHVSETELDAAVADHTINNDAGASVEELVIALANILNRERT